MTAMPKKPTGITYADRPAQVRVERFRPYADNVLVLMDHHRDARKEERTEGGLIVPMSSKEPGREQACWATVIAAGPGHYADKWHGQEKGTDSIGSSVFVPCEVKEGDRVILSGPLAGDAIVIDGLEHRVCRAGYMGSVIAVMES